MTREVNKVLVISPFPPPADGIGSHTRNLVDSWVKMGIEVSILAPSGVEEESSYQVQRVLGPLPRHRRHASDYAAQFAPDLVYAALAVSALTTSWWAALALCKELANTGIPVLAGFHEPVREVERLGPLGKSVYKQALASVSHPVAFSKVAADALVALGADPAVVPHGIMTMDTPSLAEQDRVRALYDLPSDTVSVISLGFTHADKGADTLIEASVLLAREGLTPRFLIAGSPRKRSFPFTLLGRGDEKHHEALITQAQQAKNDGADVRFAPFVRDEDLFPLLHAVEIGALPYRSITQSGVASLMLASKRPCVASSLPGLQQALGAAALFSPPDDPTGLAANIKALLAEDRRSVLSRAAGAIASSQSYDTVATMLLDVAS